MTPAVNPKRGNLKMNDEKKENQEELNCEVTVYDGAHNTCDMVAEDSGKEEEEIAQKDYDI